MQIKARIFLGQEQVKKDEMKKIILNNIYVDRVINSIVNERIKAS